MRNPSEDLALVARCKRELPHQHKAFEQLVGNYKDMVYTLCYRMTGNPTDAEDLLQEILTKLFLGLDKFEGPVCIFQLALSRFLQPLPQLSGWPQAGVCANQGAARR